MNGMIRAEVAQSVAMRISGHKTIGMVISRDRRRMHPVRNADELRALTCAQPQRT